MNAAFNMFQTMARASVEQMLYCLVEGTLLALAVWLLLRLLPRKNSGTRFAVWFSVLIAMLFLPLLSSAWKTGPLASAPLGAVKAPVMVPASWALYVFAAWAMIATVALGRVAIGIWQIYKLIRSCAEIELAALDPAVRRIIEEFRQSRPVSLCVSDEIQVPTAIGFFRPAVIVPAWFLNDVSTAELTQVLLHELTHLRRRDDWTNLAQKIVKALLFFHPSVWWIEQRLSLEREMACDDAVLSRTPNALDYAQCLTRVAERSFLRRQVALAQAAVDRMKQLSLRVARILDVNRPGNTRLWKPAIPLVMVVASLCGVSAWEAPTLIGFEDQAPKQLNSSVYQAADVQQPARQLNAALGARLPEPKMVLAKADVAKPAPRSQSHNVRMTRRSSAPRMMQAKMLLPTGNYFVQQQAVVITTSEGQQTFWRVRMWEIHLVDTGKILKNQIPRKST